MATPEQKLTKTKRDDSRDVYKERTAIDQTIPKAAGIKNYEELLESSESALEEGNENQEGSKSMLLIKAYVAGQSIKAGYIKQRKKAPRITS